MRSGEKLTILSTTEKTASRSVGLPKVWPRNLRMSSYSVVSWTEPPSFSSLSKSLTSRCIVGIPKDADDPAPKNQTRPAMFVLLWSRAHFEPWDTAPPYGQEPLDKVSDCVLPEFL